MMGYKLRTGKFLATALAALLPMQSAFACDVFGRSWYKVDRGELGLSSPIIEIEYRNGSLFRYGKPIQKSRLLSDLKGSGSLQPRPRVLLTLNRNDIEKLRGLVGEIERSGICDETGCLYQFRFEREARRRSG